MTRKLLSIARAWDHVVLQGYSTLDASRPRRSPGRLHRDASRRLARLFHDANPEVDVRLFATWSRADQTYPQAGHWFWQAGRGDGRRRASGVRRGGRRGLATHLRGDTRVGEAWNRAIAEGFATRNPYGGTGPGAGI